MPHCTYAMGQIDVQVSSFPVGYHLCLTGKGKRSPRGQQMACFLLGSRGWLEPVAFILGIAGKKFSAGKEIQVNSSECILLLYQHKVEPQLS